MKLSELKAIINEEVRKALSEDVANSDLQKALTGIENLLDSNEPAMLTEAGFVWTQEASEGLAALGAQVGLGPIASHIVLFGGLILALMTPAMYDKYKEFVEYLKGRKMQDPAKFKAFKDEIVAQTAALSRGKRAHVTSDLNYIYQLIQNKKFDQAYRMTQRLASWIESQNFNK